LCRFVGEMSVAISMLRFFLILFNSIFVLFAGLLFGAAIWSDFEYRDYFDIVNVQPVLEFLFVTSIAIFMISLAGWTAAYKEHRGLLKIYLSLLIIVFSAQLLLSIFALAYQVEILPFFESGMLTALEALSKPIEFGFDELQSNLDCCGVRNATDWNLSVIWQNETATKIAQNNLTPLGEVLVPDSCCVQKSEFCGIQNATEENIWQSGCAGTLRDEIEDHVNIFAIVLSLTCILQLASILFSGCIINNYEQDEESEPLVTQEHTQNQE